MALKTSQVSVGTTAAQLTLPTGSGASIALKNIGANPIYIGDATVSSSSGWPLAAGEAVALQTAGGDTIAAWAVATGGSSTLAMIATNA